MFVTYKYSSIDKFFYCLIRDLKLSIKKKKEKKKKSISWGYFSHNWGPIKNLKIIKNKIKKPKAYRFMPANSSLQPVEIAHVN